MRSVQVASLLALICQAAGHGYVWSITADNTVYPGWDIYLDPVIQPTPARISYGGGLTIPIFNASSSEMACNTIHNPAPGAIAEVRAGSNITFHWSRWLYSHKGPMTAWMAPYQGDISKVDVNQLEFFKFGEDTMDAHGVWSTIRMLDVTNNTWTVVIPADIKPGNYIVRQEIIALHFAVSVPPDLASFTPISPQFYMTCFNFKVTGNGTATPKGMPFPGAYDPSSPGLHYNLKSNLTYPTNGPALYKSSYNLTLPPKDMTIVSPTGRGRDADNTYYQTQNRVLVIQSKNSAYFDSIGG